mgnify:CR=1 FL=1
MCALSFKHNFSGPCSRSYLAIGTIYTLIRRASPRLALFPITEIGGAGPLPPNSLLTRTSERIIAMNGVSYIENIGFMIRLCEKDWPNGHKNPQANYNLLRGLSSRFPLGATPIQMITIPLYIRPLSCRYLCTFQQNWFSYCFPLVCRPDQSLLVKLCIPHQGLLQHCLCVYGVGIIVQQKFTAPLRPGQYPRSTKLPHSTQNIVQVMTVMMMLIHHEPLMHAYNTSHLTGCILYHF